MAAKCSFLRIEKLCFVAQFFYPQKRTLRSHSASTVRFDKSALTKHVLDNEHSMDWTKAKIPDFELEFTKRRFIESYFVNQIPNTMNDKQNDKFPSIYLGLRLLAQTFRRGTFMRRRLCARTFMRLDF